MTSYELGNLLNLQESYIRTHWNRIVGTFEKRNIFLYKVGRGSDANYGIEFPWDPEVIHWNVDEVEMI